MICSVIYGSYDLTICSTGSLWWRLHLIWVWRAVWIWNILFIVIFISSTCWEFFLIYCLVRGRIRYSKPQNKWCILKCVIPQKTTEVKAHHHESKAFALLPGTAERTQVWAPLCWSAVTPLWSCAALPQTVCSEGVLYMNSPWPLIEWR